MSVYYICFHVYRPKTFTASQIKYNQIELYCPEGQDYFFVDFNKWSISIAIKSTEVSDDSADNDTLEIKYSIISTWNLQSKGKFRPHFKNI